MALKRPFPKSLDVKIPKEDERVLKITSKDKQEHKEKRAAYKLGFARGQLTEAFALKKKKYWK